MNRSTQRTISMILTVVGGAIPLIVAASGPLELTPKDLAILSVIAGVLLIVQGQLTPARWSRETGDSNARERRTDVIQKERGNDELA